VLVTKAAAYAGAYLCFLVYLATQLMPAAHLPAKYLCLLLGTFAFYLATQLMPAAHPQPLLLATCAFYLRNATDARCASASKVPLPAVGYATQRQQGRKKCNAKATGDPCLGATGTRAQVLATYARCAAAAKRAGALRAQPFLLLPSVLSHCFCLPFCLCVA
jgi:hypothetical protein